MMFRAFSKRLWFLLSFEHTWTFDRAYDDDDEDEEEDEEMRRRRGMRNMIDYSVEQSQMLRSKGCDLPGR